MNRIKNTAIFLFVLMLSLSLVQAQKPVTKEKALGFLLKTNRLIGHAHMAVKMGKVYTGNLGKAVRHERYAKSLYAKGMYLQSIQHSRRARLLALEAIKANRVKPTGDAIITPEETELLGAVPADQELDDALAKENTAEIKDEDLIKSNNLDLDVK